MSRVLPWQVTQWQRVCDQIASGKMPHGVLIAGPPESGKSDFASRLGRYLLCRGENKPCGECGQCKLVAAGSHPDLLSVSLEDSKQIKVEQIRDLIHWANQTAQQGGYKVCLINPAEKLNVQSANALLKVLEEPPAQTLICLVTDQPTRLLPTLRSRCQRIELNIPPREEAVAWLREQMDPGTDVELLLDIAGGMPLRVLNSIGDEYLKLRQELVSHLVPLSEGVRSPVQVAALLSGQDPGLVLELLYQLVADSIAYSLTNGKVFKNSDFAEQMERYGSLVSVNERYALLDCITEAQGFLAGTSNANAQMLLERVFVKAA